MEEENKDYWYVEYTKTKLRLDKTTKELKQQLSEFSDSLDKAKKIIKKLRALYFSPVVTKEDVKRQDEILAEAEQFLKDEVSK